MRDRDNNSRDILKHWFALAQEQRGADPIPQKRTAERAVASAPIEVQANTGEQYAAHLRDWSVKGLGIHCESRIQDRSEVRIHCVDQPDEYVDGVVAHCTETACGFQIGVRVGQP